MILTLAALGLFSLQAAEAWPQFRGPGASGVVSGRDLPVTWTPDQGVLWKRTVPGQGWSSPVIWGRRVFVTSLSGEAPVVAPKTGFYGPRETGAPKDPRRWMAFAFDAVTGDPVWERELHRGVPEHPIHVKASYAAETPVTDGERLYVLFGNLGIFCLDLDGKPLWSRRWKPSPTKLDWGTGSSPALHEGRLFVLDDNEASSSLVCYDAKSGEERWRAAREEGSSWSTPFLWSSGARTEIVTVATRKVRSYDLDGRLLWELGGMSSICVPTPIAANGLLYLNSGYEFARPRPLLAVRPGASGDISLKPGETSNAFVAWYREPAGCYHPSPLVLGGRLYVVYSTGFLGCFDAATGADAYPRQRLEGPFTASPVSDGKRIYCLNEAGETFVIEDGPAFKLLSRNPLGEMSLATPAISGGRLYLRTLTRLYCVGAP